MSTMITFQCGACNADYDLAIASVIDKSKAVRCPNCTDKPPAGKVHTFALALEELLSSMASLRSKVHFELNLDTEELPPPYGAPDDDEAGLPDFPGETDGERGGFMGDFDDDDDDDDDDDEDDDDFDELDEDIDDDDDEFFDPEDEDDDDDDFEN